MQFNSMKRCQLDRIQLDAFAKLKLVVELDLSWNKLDLIPMQTMRDLSLMRRFTMRGNPLKKLDEFSFGYNIEHPDDHTKSIHLTINSLLKNQSKKQLDAIHKLYTKENLNMLNRFVETYPGLARYLVNQQQQTTSDTSNLPLFDNDKWLNDETSKSILHNQLLQIALKQLIREANLTLSSKTSELATAADLDANKLILEDDLELATSMDNEIDINPSSDDSSNETFEADLSEQNSIEIANANANLQPGKSSNQNQHQFKSMGFYWKHLQELDFGQCQLTYIKWTTFENLNELKRLFLDGNKLRLVLG